MLAIVFFCKNWSKIPITYENWFCIMQIAIATAPIIRREEKTSRIACCCCCCLFDDVLIYHTDRLHVKYSSQRTIFYVKWWMLQKPAGQRHYKNCIGHTFNKNNRLISRVQTDWEKDEIEHGMKKTATTEERKQKQQQHVRNLWKGHNECYTVYT